MKKTPETDKEAFDAENFINHDGGDSIVVLAEFARRLETQRDEARRKLSYKEQTLSIAEQTIKDLHTLIEKMESRIKKLSESQ